MVANALRRRLALSPSRTLWQHAPTEGRLGRVDLQGGFADLERQCFVPDEGSVRPLRVLEARLLGYLAARPGEIIPYAELLVEVWGYRAEHPTGVVHTTARRLRKVLDEPSRAPRHLFNVRGEGYRFVPLQGTLETAGDTLLLDAFIGREAECATLVARAMAGGLITLVGFGGVGKTRLVRQVARILRQEHGRDITFVALADVQTADGLTRAVARALGLPHPEEDAVTRLGRALAARPEAVLILDNLEQLVEEARPVLSAWLPLLTAPTQVLATSRIPLGIDGEQVVPVHPLPDRTHGDAPSPALQLYLARARQVAPDLVLTGRLREQADDLMQRLDGLPLAIELAAARARVLGPDRILERLEHLRDRGAGRPDRHRSLDAVLAWSWDLLDPVQQRILVGCGTFDGTFDLALAEAVLDPGEDPRQVDEHLDDLCAASLVRHEADSLRFTLFQSVRSFARERLRASGDEPAHLERLGEALARRTSRESLDASVAGEGALDRLDRLLLEVPNLRRVAEADLGDVAARCAVALAALVGLAELPGTMALLHRFLSDPDLRAETRIRVARWHAGLLSVRPGDGPDVETLLAEALELASRGDDAQARSDLLYGRSRLRTSRGQQARALEDAVAAVDEAMRVGDELREARARAFLGRLYKTTGRSDDALTEVHRALALAQTLPCPEVEVVALGRIGSIQLERGRHDLGVLHLEQAERLLRDRWPMDPGFLAGVLIDLSNVNMDLGDMPLARARLDEALQLARRCGDLQRESMTELMLCSVCHESGDDYASEVHGRRSLRLAREAGHPTRIAIAGLYLAIPLTALGRTDEARGLFDRAIQHGESTAFVNMVAEAWYQRGAVAFQTGDLEDAWSCLSHAEPLQAQVGSDKMRVNSLARLARIAHRRGNGADAARLLDGARALLARLDADPRTGHARAVRDASSELA